MVWRDQQQQLGLLRLLIVVAVVCGLESVFVTVVVGCGSCGFYIGVLARHPCTNPRKPRTKPSSIRICPHHSSTSMTYIEERGRHRPDGILANRRGLMKMVLQVRMDHHTRIATHGPRIG